VRGGTYYSLGSGGGYGSERYYNAVAFYDFCMTDAQVANMFDSGLRNYGPLFIGDYSKQYYSGPFKGDQHNGGMLYNDVYALLVSYAGGAAITLGTYPAKGGTWTMMSFYAEYTENGNVTTGATYSVARDNVSLYVHQNRNDVCIIYASNVTAYIGGSTSTVSNPNSIFQGTPNTRYSVSLWR
jgi:hypothetical protein